MRLRPLSTVEGPGTGGCTPLTGVQPYRPSGPLGATSKRRELRGLDRRVGNLRRISDAPVPATAPRPASGDADQTPLGHGGGIIQVYSRTYILDIAESNALLRETVTGQR